MPSWVTPDATRRVAQAGTLATTLEALGLHVTVYKEGGHQEHPCIVFEGDWPHRLPVPSGTVYVAPDYAGDGKDYFWLTPDTLEWLEPIAPAGEIPLAALNLTKGRTWHSL